MTGQRKNYAGELEKSHVLFTVRRANRPAVIYPPAFSVSFSAQLHRPCRMRLRQKRYRLWALRLRQRGFLWVRRQQFSAGFRSRFSRRANRRPKRLSGGASPRPDFGARNGLKRSWRSEPEARETASVGVGTDFSAGRPADGGAGRDRPAGGLVTVWTSA